MTAGAIPEATIRNERLRLRLKAIRSFARRFANRPDGVLGVLVLLVFVILAIAPNLFVGDLQTATTATGPSLDPPSATHLLGTDELGRDILNLTIHGTRISMVIGLLATIVTILLGAFVGIVSGYVGGRVDVFLMRITDFFLVLPTFVLALILAPIILDLIGANSSVFGIRVTLLVIVVVIGVTSWASTARIIRSQTLSVKERAFVGRARVIGSGPGPHHVAAHPAQRDEPDRGQHGPRLRRLDPDRDDPVVHRPGRSVRAVVGPGPQRRRVGRRDGPGRLVVRGPAIGLHRPRRPGLHPGRLGPRRRPQPAPEGPPMTEPRLPSGGPASSETEEEAAATAARSAALDAQTIIRGRRQWPLPRQADPNAPLLVVEHLTTRFKMAGGSIKAVDDVSFRLNDGEALGIAGESGCGKTTTALSLVRLLPANGRIGKDSSVKLFGIDLAKKSEDALRRYRWREISIIFQGAMNALNPVRRVNEQIAEPVELRLKVNKADAMKRAGELLELVGIPARRGRAYPHELSGGMRQRAMIAMALACDPAVVIGDEPTTALDVMVQAQILELLERLRRELGLSLILITHDLSVIAETCDRVMIMYAGQGGRGGCRQHRLPDAAPPVHPEADRRLPQHPCRPPDARRDPRLAARPARPAARLPLPSALPVRDGGLLGRGAARGDVRRRRPGCLPPLPAGQRRGADHPTHEGCVAGASRRRRRARGPASSATATRRSTSSRKPSIRLRPIS